MLVSATGAYVTCAQLLLSTPVLRYVWPTMDTYVGEWVEDVRTGHGENPPPNPPPLASTLCPGMMTFQNGEVYCGAWVRDLRHGEGVHTFVDGSRYEGQWENDALHGRGIFYYSDGSVFAGQFDSNKRHGPGEGVSSFVLLLCFANCSSS
jgi:hypothetical protein